MTAETMPYEAAAVYPTSDEAAIKHCYIGRSLQDVQAPAVVIDAAVARRNCNLMLKTTADLGVEFRAHVKTHKSTQLARMQVGEGSADIRLIVSTVAEAESLLPWLLESRANSKKVNILYGLPVVPSAIPRLARLAQLLGPGSIAMFVDSSEHVKLLNASQWPHTQMQVFVVVDVGYGREGVAAGTSQMKELAEALKTAKHVQLLGFYAHQGLSYGVSSPEEALKSLIQELQGLESFTHSFLGLTGNDNDGHPSEPPLILSLGASPTATATQNLADGSATAKSCKALLDKVKKSFTVEIHAGVYPLLDMQQLATRARPTHASSDASRTLLSFNDLGLGVLVEVAGVYDERDAPEALIAAGSIALGREPCKSYPGWGVVSTWPSTTGQTYDPEGSQTGWIVGSISQEHGVLRWVGSRAQFRPLHLGEKIMIWPNHACMSGPNFAFYLVVDSELPRSDTITDIWTRCRGW